MLHINYRTHSQYWGYYDNPYEEAVYDPGDTVGVRLLLRNTWQAHKQAHNPRHVHTITTSSVKIDPLLP